VRKVKLLDSWEQIELLGDDTRVAILELCITPNTVTKLAEALQVPRTRLYHHVNRLTEHGLLRVVKTKQVGPVTESQYQVSARSFRPSRHLKASLSEPAMGAALLTIVLGPARADFVRSLEEGAFKLVDSSGKRRVHLARYLMNLTPDELDELVTGLEDLYARFDPDPTVQRPGTIPVSAVSLIHPRWVRPR
jgi:DNA-binding transcriptional ArsR family regulator